MYHKIHFYQKDLFFDNVYSEDAFLYVAAFRCIARKLFSKLVAGHPCSHERAVAKKDRRSSWSYCWSLRVDKEEFKNHGIKDVIKRVRNGISAVVQSVVHANESDNGKSVKCSWFSFRFVELPNFFALI